MFSTSKSCPLEHLMSKSSQQGAQMYPFNPKAKRIQATITTNFTSPSSIIRIISLSFSITTPNYPKAINLQQKAPILTVISKGKHRQPYGVFECAWLANQPHRRATRCVASPTQASPARLFLCNLPSRGLESRLDPILHPILAIINCIRPTRHSRSN